MLIDQTNLRDVQQALFLENETITNQVIALESQLQQKDFNHKRDIDKAKKRSHRAGQDSVVDELGRVWSSNEFAAELINVR